MNLFYKQLIFKLKAKLYSLKSSRRKKIYIHIGSPKTGTTAIQKYLNECNDKLKIDKVYYPLIGRKTHLDNKSLFINGTFLTYFNYDKKEAKKILDEFLSSIYETMILSEEMLFIDNIHDTKKLNFLNREKLLGYLTRFDIKIIVYFRPPLEYMSSLWKEYLLKGEYSQLEHFLTNYPIENSFELIDDLKKILGEKNVIVKKYSHRVLDDFLKELGLKKYNYQDKMINESYSRAFCEKILYVTKKINLALDQNIKILNLLHSLNKKGVNNFDSIQMETKLKILDVIKKRCVRKNQMLLTLIECEYLEIKKNVAMKKNIKKNVSFINALEKKEIGKILKKIEITTDK